MNLLTNRGKIRFSNLKRAPGFLFNIPTSILSVNDGLNERHDVKLVNMKFYYRGMKNNNKMNKSNRVLFDEAQGLKFFQKNCSTNIHCKF